ncbi:hypothetical protein [Viridibacterium curvum]
MSHSVPSRLNGAVSLAGLALALSACTVNLNVPPAVASANVVTSPAPAPTTPVATATPVKPVATPAATAPASANGASTSLTATTWSEQFSARDSTFFLTPAYAAIPTDSSKPLYATPSPGSLRVADGALTLSNARFTVGALGSTPTSSATPGGVFNMVGKTCALTLNVRSVSGTGNFYVYVDNNTTSQDNSPHGKVSRVVNVGASSLTEGQNIFKWSIPKASFTGESFMQIRADSASTVVIDSANLSCV